MSTPAAVAGFIAFAVMLFFFIRTVRRPESIPSDPALVQMAGARPVTRTLM